MADGGESLRDYFIRFLFRTDKDGAAKVQRGIQDITVGLDRAGKKAFEFNEKLDAMRRIAWPFQKIADLVLHTADEADALGDLSERTGIASEKLEQFGFIAQMSGTSAETLVTGLRVLEKQMGGVLAGGKEQTKLFAKLGLSVHNAAGKIKTVDELLPDVAKAFQKLPSHAQKSAYAMELFGRAGQELLPMLAKGPDAIRDLQAELRDLGGVTSEEFLASASLWDDILHKLAAAWKGVRQAIAGPIIDAMNKVAQNFIAWWRASGQVIRSRIVEWTQQFVDSLNALWRMLTRIALPLLGLAALLNAPLLVMVGMRAMIALLIDDFAHWMAGNDSLIGRAVANWDTWLMKLGDSHPVLAGILSYFGDFVQWVHDHVIQLGKDWDDFLSIVTDDSFSLGDTIKAFFQSVADFMLAPITDTWDRIKNAVFDTLMKMKSIARALGMDDLAGSLGQMAGSVMGGEGVRQSPGFAGASMAPSISGPSSSPMALGAGAVGPSTGSVEVKAPVTVNVTASPGMDTRQLAEEIDRRVGKAIDSSVRSAYNSLVPERY